MTRRHAFLASVFVALVTIACSVIMGKKDDGSSASIPEPIEIPNVTLDKPGVIERAGVPE